MNLHDWIDELCDVLDIDIEVDEALVLDLARDAAHNVQRPAAPITTFLLGYAAAARAQGDPERIERLAEAATQLALHWDGKVPDGEAAPDAPALSDTGLDDLEEDLAEDGLDDDEE